MTIDDSSGNLRRYQILALQNGVYKRRLICLSILVFNDLRICVCLCLRAVVALHAFRR